MAREAGAGALITTAKDAVKLTGWSSEIPLYVLEIELTFDREAELRGWLREILSGWEKP